ncbi:peptidylprolyl isomerase [Candidatus Pelagibacter sp.]|nr:peptidylprolyl isomerase [Candidatus Pelagibacter sp.]
MMKKKFIVLILFTLLTCKSYSNSQSYIILKINNQIITNHDVEREIKYLIAINDKLESLDKKEIKKFALSSLTREIIKKKELLKFYNLGKNNQIVNNQIVSLYKSKNLRNLTQLEEYLDKYDMSVNDIKKKFEIEVVWNELIYQKYNKNIEINEEFLKKKITAQFNKKESQIIYYQLSEILYPTQNADTSKKIYNEILNSIIKNGFPNTASIYSVSDTAKNNGEVGWVNRESLSKNIINEIKDLDFGKITRPIVVPGGILILQLNNKKIEVAKYNLDKKLDELIALEKNKQYNQFSLLYFNKIKFNSTIDEK